jgi:hypothetical protein
MKPTFFRAPAEFRSWLKQHHATAEELLVGFYKRKSGKPSITWPEAVDQALCYGWIDGLRKSIDDASYVIRFTRRRPGSIWSAINAKRVKELDRLGLMRAAGLKAFKALKTSRVYSYEQRNAAALSRADERMFRAEPEGLGVLPGSGALVPQERHLVDRQRQEGRDEAQTACQADGVFKARAGHTTSG